MSRTETERTEIPDPEVVPTAQRRRFSSAEKLRIVEAADACTESGEMGGLLRREGIYSSYLSRWRRARGRGELTTLSPKKRGPKPPAAKASVAEVAKLRRENERLQARLAQAEVIIEVQKKLLQLLGPSPETSGNKEGE